MDHEGWDIKLGQVSPKSVIIPQFLNEELDKKYYNSEDYLLRGTSLASFLLNQANCSLAPKNCSALNREPCFATAHTCGRCLSSAFVGYDGDRNTACLPLHLVATARRALMVSEEVETKTKKLQSCAGDCSGHCSCVFKSSLAPFDEVDVCDEGDLSCSATCLCEEGYQLSVACDVSYAQLLEKMGYREQVIKGILGLAKVQAASEQSIETWINSLLAVNQSPYELSEAAMSSVLSLSSQALALVQEKGFSTGSSLTNLVSTLGAISQAIVLNSEHSSRSGRTARSRRRERSLATAQREDDNHHEKTRHHDNE